MCGLHHRFAPLRSRTLRRIPQVVSTVATRKYRHLRKRLRGGVSIPQAVSTVATRHADFGRSRILVGVSIPQAVSTVATVKLPSR